MVSAIMPSTVYEANVKKNRAELIAEFASKYGTEQCERRFESGNDRVCFSYSSQVAVRSTIRS